MEGFEPPRANAHCALNAARLPVPPHRLVFDCKSYSTLTRALCQDLIRQFTQFFQNKKRPPETLPPDGRFWRQ